MNVTVVIPTHNRLGSLKRALASLENQTYRGGNLEIVVAADHCSDGTVEWLSTIDSPDLKFVQPITRGAAAARNAALASASGDLIIFMDDDMEAHPQFVDAHAAAHARGSSEQLVVVGYSPVEVNDDSSALVRSLAAGFDKYFAMLRSEGDEPRDRGIPGGNFSVMADLLRHVGGFDESLRYREDVDLGIRLRQAGARLRFAADAATTQHIDLSIDDMIARAAPRAAADLQLLSRHPTEASLLELGRSVSDAAARRRFRAFWHLGGLIEVTARAMQHISPRNSRLGSWRYRARYATRIKRSIGSWNDMVAVVGGTRPHAEITRVLHLLGSANPGGIESFVIEMARNIDRTRFDMTVCILGDDGPVASELRSMGVKVRLLGSGTLRKAETLRTYAEMLRTGRFHVLHAHAGGRAHRLLARRLFGMRVIRHLHGIQPSFIDSVRRDDARAASYFARAFAGSDLGLVCSDWLAARVISSPARAAAPVSVFHYGVDLDRFKPGGSSKDLRESLGITDQQRIVGFVGRMVEQKGIPWLLDVAELIGTVRKDVTFVVVGDGPLLAGTQTQLRDRRIENVKLVGAFADVAPFMGAFDVLALTSEWEPFGIVSLEAMASAKPVVAFAVDGIPEAVIDGETGILVPPNDVQAFADGLLLLLTDDDLRQALGVNGRRRVTEFFDVSKTAKRLESVYDDVRTGSLDRNMPVR